MEASEGVIAFRSPCDEEHEQRNLILKSEYLNSNPHTVTVLKVFSLKGRNWFWAVPQILHFSEQPCDVSVADPWATLSHRSYMTVNEQVTSQDLSFFTNEAEVINETCFIILFGDQIWHYYVVILYTNLN